MNAPGLSVLAIGSPVRIVRFHESPSRSRLVLLHLLLCMGFGFGVGLDVAGDTEQTDVVNIVAESFHLLHRSTRLYGNDVMAVELGGQATSNDAFFFASLTTSVGTSPHNCLGGRPSLTI